MNYRRIAQLRTSRQFSDYTRSLGINLPFDEVVQPDGPLAQPYMLKTGQRIGNRFCVLPMEGWDGTVDGKPTEFTYRRWKNFGISGAKLIWGCEAVAVRHDGRANPNQLMITAENKSGIESLRKVMLDTHTERYGNSDDMLVGLQLTHSGRFSRPNDKIRLEPKIAYHHPILDKLFNISPNLPPMSDSELDDLIGDYIRAARQAHETGFNFVDIKHCHGYLGHELLSARSRPGRYGGSFENRTHFFQEIVRGIQRDCPGLLIGVRLSAFDYPPFRSLHGKMGQPILPEEDSENLFAFGCDTRHPLEIQLNETIQFLELAQNLNIELICLTAGSPYYNPHIQRPALFPPSDGYAPPEDPLVGVARQINVGAELKYRFPELAIVGSAYTYLQEWLPNVAQYVVREKWADFIGLGRMMLAYPEFPIDVLSGKALQRKRICRTFSDCTTAPRNGLISGCYPLDEFYKQLPEAGELIRLKR